MVIEIKNLSCWDCVFCGTKENKKCSNPELSKVNYYCGGSCDVYPEVAIICKFFQKREGISEFRAEYIQKQASDKHRQEVYKKLLEADPEHLMFPSNGPLYPYTQGDR